MLPHRILIVEDEAKILEHLSRTLEEEGFSNFTCGSYRELETMIRLPVKRFDLIILDRLLNGRDSAGLIHNIKDALPESQIMILSAINTSSEKAALLDSGADDYLAKPFDTTELIARVRALLRRSRHEIRFSDLILEIDSRTMKTNGQEVPLSNKEFLLLRTLVQSPGKVFNKNNLNEQVWDMSPDVESHVVEATVNKLRKKLAEHGSKVQIRNTRNIGYWIEE